MKIDSRSMLLYAVTDRSWLGGKTVAMQVEEALLGGATFIQLREKELDDVTFLAEAKEIKALCARFKVPFVINDNVEITLQSDADGIHIGQGDMPANQVRELLGDDKIIGVSVNNVEQALLAQEQGADYLGVGAVFSTSTKLDADSVSFEMLRNICEAVKIPVVAIGGISRDNIMKLAGSRVDGVAVVSALFAQEDIASAARELAELSKNMVKSATKSMDIEGVIFDLDGVILDSMPVWDEIGKRYLIKCGIEPRKDICEVLRPMSLMQAAEYLKSEYGITKTSEEIIQGINSQLEDFYLFEAGLKPGVEAFIKRLSLENVKMCITTATERALVDAALIRNNIDEYFGKVFTCNELGHGKDEAVIYQAALEFLGTPKDRTLVIEDAYHAVMTAKNAGFTVAAVYDASEAIRRKEIQASADFYIESFEKGME